MPLAVEPRTGSGPIQRLGADRPPIAAKTNLLDAHLSFLEQPLTMLLQRLAPLIYGDGFSKRNVAAFQAIDNLFELSQGALERHSVYRGGVGQSVLPKCADSAPIGYCIKAATCAAADSTKPSKS